jgi:hypothetical protein
MKNYIKILLILLFLPFVTVAQDQDSTKVKEKLERPSFEGATLIDNPTNVLFNKNTLEIQMAHRFGLINGGTQDLAGFWAPANIRIGVSYAILDRLTIGFGTTKGDLLQDFNWKAAILRQTRSNSMPVSLSYYGNFTVDARKDEGFYHIQDRYSFFNQLIIAKRFSPEVSLQLAPSISHYNKVESTLGANDLIAIAFGGRFKVSPQTALIVDYTQPVTTFSQDDPKPGLSVGVEFSTSAHTFQLFATNYDGIIPQKNIMFNQHDFFNGDFLIGFNITRKYNF